MKLSAAHDSRGSEHPDVRRQIDEEEVRMPSLMTPRAVQVTPLQLVFMNHEAPPSIAIDIQSWVRFGSGQLAKAQSERAAHQAQWEGVNFGRRSPSSGGQNCTPNNI